MQSFRLVDRKSLSFLKKSMYVVVNGWRAHKVKALRHTSGGGPPLNPDPDLLASNFGHAFASISSSEVQIQIQSGVD